MGLKVGAPLLRFSSVFSPFLHEGVELFMLYEEAVVSEIRFHHPESGTRDRVGEFFQTKWREEDVGTYADNQRVGFYFFEGFMDAPSASTHVMGIAAFADAHV